MKRILLSSAILSLAILPLARAEDKSSTPQDQIAALGQAYVEAFNKGDAQAVAAFWLPDGDYVDQFGNRVAGREALQKLFTDFFASEKGAQLRIDSESLKFVTPDLATEDGTTAVFSPGAPLPSRARFSNTLVRKDGKWYLSGVRESTFAPPDRSKELAPLAGFIGDWQAKAKSGETILLSIAPAPGGNFLVAQRTVIVGGGPVSGGTEWIAWDPAKKIFRSWNFNADGGFGESVWTPSGQGWTVESHYTLRDGTALREVQSFAPGGSGEITVSTLGLAADQKDLPKPADLQFSRQPTN